MVCGAEGVPRAELEADLLRYYGVDLADLWRGELSLRRLSVLLNALPPDSAIARWANTEAPGWDVQDFLLADIYAAITGQQHPARPDPLKKAKQTRAKSLRTKLQAQRARVEASK